MIPPIQGSSLFHDSSLNMTPRKNCNISRYKYPNDISQDILDRAQTLISMVKFSYPEGETVTCGSLYKLSTMNNSELSHCGKTIISPNW